MNLLGFVLVCFYRISTVSPFEILISTIDSNICMSVNDSLTVPLTLSALLRGDDDEPRRISHVAIEKHQTLTINGVFMSNDASGNSTADPRDVAEIGVHDRSLFPVEYSYSFLASLTEPIFLGNVPLEANRVGDVFAFANLTIATGGGVGGGGGGEKDSSSHAIRIFFVSAVRSCGWNEYIDAIGWVYVVAWCLCFYPQIYLLWSTRSSDGYSYDMLLLNVMDQTAMLLQTYLIFFSPQLRREYDRLHPMKPLPIYPNDLASITHNFLAQMVIAILVKVAYKSKAHQEITRPYLAILVGSVFSLLVGVYLASASYISWLEAVFILGYIKTALGLVKYAPQALLNFRRKSTEGFAVGMMIFDLIGGAFSLLQMILIAVNHEDGASLTGNPGKLGTGIVTCVFEIIFLLQKYVIYRPGRAGNRRDFSAEYAPIGGTDSRERT